MAFEYVSDLDNLLKFWDECIEKKGISNEERQEALDRWERLVAMRISAVAFESRKIVLEARQKVMGY